MTTKYEKQLLGDKLLNYIETYGPSFTKIIIDNHFEDPYLRFTSTILYVMDTPEQQELIIILKNLLKKSKCMESHAHCSISFSTATFLEMTYMTESVEDSYNVLSNVKMVSIKQSLKQYKNLCTNLFMNPLLSSTRIFIPEFNFKPKDKLYVYVNGRSENYSLQEVNEHLCTNIKDNYFNQDLCIKYSNIALNTINELGTSDKLYCITTFIDPKQLYDARNICNFFISFDENEPQLSFLNQKFKNLSKYPKITDDRINLIYKYSSCVYPTIYPSLIPKKYLWTYRSNFKWNDHCYLMDDYLMIPLKQLKDKDCLYYLLKDESSVKQLFFPKKWDVKNHHMFSENVKHQIFTFLLILNYFDYMFGVPMEIVFFIFTFL